jgi:hypothetical protein
MNYKFHIVPSSHPKVRYQHEMVSLCEGLRLRGREFYGSCNYWMEPARNEFLLKEAPASFKSDVDVYNTYYFEAFPEKIRNVDYSKINILIDREDGLYGAYGHPQFKKFQLILRTHYNGNINYSYFHPNIRPWAFGLSERIMEAIDLSFDEKTVNRINVNFRIPHVLRDKAAAGFMPVIEGKYPLYNQVTAGFDSSNPGAYTAADQIHWDQTGHRHDPAYYKLLNGSLLTSAFGGFIFIKPFATNRIVRQFQLLYKLKAALLSKMGWDNSACYFIDQYDSWRLWESFYAKTCPLHMDFEDWNFILPVMPENKVHYWGVRRFDFEASAHKLLSLHPDDVLQIAFSGRKWAAEHYSPAAVAKRFEDLIGELKA